jgi:hypothetical protein
MRAVELITDHRPTMTLAERAALEGLVARLRPELAVEIGTFTGASLERIARWSGEVHSFDVDPRVERPPPNVVFHRGDSKRLLPQVLARFEAEGRNVGFALVDGEHTPEGVRADVEQLLQSDAVRDTAILFHDTMNEAVREGIGAIDFRRYPKVVYTDLDFLEVTNDKPPLAEYWSGLGLLLVDAEAAPVSVRRPASFWGTSPWRLLLWRLAARPRRLKRRLEPPAVRLFTRLPRRVQDAARRRRENPWERSELPGEVEREESVTASR